MNKCFKVIWNHATQSWQAVSELATSAKKTKSAVNLTAAALMVGVAGQAIAADPFPRTTLTGTQAVTVGDVYHYGTDVVLFVDRNATATINGVNGETIIEFNPNRDRDPTRGAVTWNAVGITATNDVGPKVLTATDNVTINIIPNALDSQGGGRHGVTSLFNSDFTFNKNLTVNNKGIIAGAGSPEHYGVMAGSGNDWPDTLAPSHYNTLTVKGDLTVDMSMANPSAIQTIAGIRSIGGDTRQSRSNRGGFKNTNSNGRVTVDGKTTITMDGAYAQGIYVSGESLQNPGGPSSEVILNGDSQITMKNGLYGSAALKIGKSRDVYSENKGRHSFGAGKGVVVSNGNMVLDTTQSNGAAIQIQESNSKFIANATTASTKIDAKSSALTVGATDWTTHNKSENIEVRVNDAIWRTTTANKDLIEVTHEQKNALVEFTGAKTDLLAATDGWLLREDQNSSTTLNLSEGQMTGLTYKGSTTDQTVSVLNVNLDNKGTWNLNEKGSTTTTYLDNLNISNQAVLNGAYESTGANNFTVKAITSSGMGTVTSDNGIINLAHDSKPGDILTLDANYEGKNGAVVRMDTVWNHPGDFDGGNSFSDVLHITGTATGMTDVVPVGADGKPNIIEGSVQKIVNQRINTIPVVKVGVSGANAFKGEAQTDSAGKTYLVKRTVGNQDQYYWTLDAEEPTPEPELPRTPIYKESVPGLVAMPHANLEQGYLTMGTLHERRGDNASMAWDACGCVAKHATAQTWGRLFGKHLEMEGRNRFNYDSDMYGFQIGHDFELTYDEQDQSRTQTGIFGGYVRNNLDFYDRYRVDNAHYMATGNIRIADDKYTGSGHSDGLHIGASHTRYHKNGSYLDLVGQLGYLRNVYQPRADGHRVSQDGVSVGLSAEVGRPWAIGDSNWTIEPQAQLMYQYLALEGIRPDEHTKVASSDHHGLRGRLGVRLAHHSNNHTMTDTFYGIANVYHDFSGAGAVKIGRDSIKERYNRTWWEVGAGLQLPLTAQSHIYGDVRYERNFGSEKREGYKGTVGFKYTWK